MALAPMRLCRCGHIHRETRCLKCVQAYELQRGTPAARGYDGKWRIIRAAFIKAHPRCCICGQPTQEVDHIDGDSSHNAWSNLRPFCKSHHSSRTARDQSGWGTR